MVVTITSIAYAIRKASNSTVKPIVLGHAHQLVAAAFGYKSYASYQASEEEAADLIPSAHYVINPLLVTRAQELQLSHAPAALIDLIKAAFTARLPTARVHSSDADLNAYLREFVVKQAADDIDVRFYVDVTNHDGSEEIDLPFGDIAMADLPPRGTVWEIEVVGHISIDPETDRTDSGRTVDVEAILSLERKGKACIANPVFEVLSAELNYKVGRDRARMYEEDDIPQVSLAEALADHLNLDLAEAEELADAEVEANDSADGMVYSYFFDFTPYNATPVGQKLMAHHGSLRIEVPASFFDQVRPSFD